MADDLQRKQDELIGLIYDGVLCPDVWQTWLDKLVAASASRSGFLFLQHQDTLAVASMLTCDFGEELALYNREYYKQDIWIRNALRLPMNVVHPSQAMCPQKELHATAFYNELCRVIQVEHIAGAYLSMEGPWRVALAVHRTPAQGEYTDAEVAWLNRFVPHLRRALHLSRVMDQSMGNFEAAVARLPVPCVVLNRQKVIIASNDSARRLIAAHPGLAIKQDRLVLKNTTTARQLDTLIADSFRTISTSEGQGGGLVTLPGADHPSIVISVTPFRRGAHIWHQDGGDAVAWLFYDPAQKRTASGEILQAMYDLTPAESRVAVLLSQGRSVTEIADSLKISVDGVRYHLKAIFGKTGARRQSEVTSLLLSHGVEIGEQGNGREKRPDLRQD